MRMRRGLAAGVMAALSLTASANANAAHAFDLASAMPPHLAIMFTMAWFGVTQADPQGAGGDATYSLWHQEFPQCTLANDPSVCAAFAGAGMQRSIASKRRPLAGIYSSSGRTPESQRRIDLMLSTLRRPCDAGARIDAWGIQLDSVQFTSRYPQNKQSETWDIAYRALLAFLDRADAAGLAGAVVPSNDATVYWHFGGTYGLTTQAERKAALTKDIADMATIASLHASSVKIKNRPLLSFYVDAALMTVAEWQAVLDAARAASGVDFYALGTTLDAAYFGAFDALTPWVNLGIWSGAQGASLRTRAAAYGAEQHRSLVAQVKTFQGRVVFGSVAPGFDDYTEDWGACTAREIPRDPAVLVGQFDALGAIKQSADVRGLVFQTWDDWTEGTEFEPDVTDGTAKLVALRQLVGGFYGEANDAAGDLALDQKWKAFGQARSCCFALGGTCADAGTPAPVAVRCPAQPSSDAGPIDPVVDAGVTPDASIAEGGASAEQPSGTSSGCACRAESAATASTRSTATTWATLALALGLVARRRRRSR